MDYYTLEVTYSTPTGKIGETKMEVRKDLSAEGFPSVSAWLDHLKKSIFYGFTVQTAPGTLEIISPFRICTVYLKKQPHKFAP